MTGYVNSCALHRDEMENALNEGSLSYPTVAVQSVDSVPFAYQSIYGNIMAVFPDKTIDPAQRQENHLYQGDALVNMLPKDENFKNIDEATDYLKAHNYRGGYFGEYSATLMAYKSFDSLAEGLAQTVITDDDNALLKGGEAVSESYNKMMSMIKKRFPNGIDVTHGVHVTHYSPKNIPLSLIASCGFQGEINPDCKTEEQQKGVYDTMRSLFENKYHVPFTDAECRQVLDFVNTVQKSPVPWLNAVPARNVDLHEAELFLLPEGAYPDLMKRMKDMNLPVKEYTLDHGITFDKILADSRGKDRTEDTIAPRLDEIRGKTRERGQDIDR